MSKSIFHNQNIQINQEHSEEMYQKEKVRNKLIKHAIKMHRNAIMDPFRPSYDFISPGGWMNDPNGPIFYNNRYHIFFQYCSLKNRWSLPMS